MERRACRVAVHWVAKSKTQLSNYHTHTTLGLFSYSFPGSLRSKIRLLIQDLSVFLNAGMDLY